MKAPIVALLLAVSAFAAEDGWKELFDGKTLEGWTQQNEANWRVEEGVIVVDEGGVGLLTTDYQDENPLKTGLIGLQKNDGKVEFRNIRIRTLE